MTHLSAHSQKGIVLLFLLILSPSVVLAQETCNEKFRAANHETLLESSKCGRDCSDTYYYERDARNVCWDGCNAVRDASYKSAAEELDKCLTRRDGNQTQSPQPTEAALPKEPTGEESEPTKPPFDSDVKIFDVLRINPLEMFNQLELITDAHIFLTTDVGTSLAVRSFLGTEPNSEAEAQEIESFDTFLEGLKEGAIKLPLSPVRFDLLEKPPEYIVEVTIDPAIVKYGPALIEVKSYNGEAGILINGDVPMLEQGAVDVFVEPGSNEGFQIQTPDADFFVVLTKFSIIHSKQSSKTLLAVYEGEVEVKTRDGQTVRVSPNGGEPGVLVVGRKLSVLKLSVVAAVILATAGAIVWFIKRKKKK